MLDLQKHIDWVINAHQKHPKKPGNALRFWDMKTPYAIHPIWSAMTILTETRLDEKTRYNGALTLLYHDVLEDTNKKLPSSLTSEVKQQVQNMTFKDISEEMEHVWKKGNYIILLKLYDKVSNLMDSVWMKEKEAKEYKDYTRKLCQAVLKHYGNLNITKIAEDFIN